MRDALAAARRPEPEPEMPAPALGRPRVLALTVGFTVGGVEQLLLMTAPRLQREGFDVTVACLKRWDVMGDELQARGVRAIALGARRVLAAQAAGRLLSLLRRERIQILHAHLFQANVAARVLGRVAGVPVVLTSHHDTDLWMRPHHRLVERLTAPMSDRVLACSDAVRRYALRSYGLSPGRVKTLLNAIEIPATAGPDQAGEAGRRATVRRELGAGPADLLVGTVGRLLEPKKGLAVFLAAARLLARELPSARFVLVGDGPARADLERRAAREGVSHCTEFAGTRRDVHAVMGALDLFVQPSLWEGFGLTVLEAMAAGRAVVATRVGGAVEVVRDGETGLLVPPGDPMALASACAALLRDRERAARFGRAGRDHVEAHFRIERLVDETAALYRALLRERGAAARKEGA